MSSCCCFFLLLAILQHSHKVLSFIGVDGEVGVLISPSSSPPNPSTDHSEYTALQAWKSAITEDPSGVLTTWVGPDVCSYKGIFCESLYSSSPVVLGIDLNHANLKGTLVEELSFLTHLSIIHLNTNRFSGSVPDSFRQLRFLSELDLSNNLFTGPFPTQTLLIPNLIYLDLRFNQFSGEIPDELFERDLDAIFLNNNQFEGQIPMSLWASPASVITLANNFFSGSLPPSFGYTGSNIKQILLLNNKLTGCIPEGVGYLNDIEVLDLSFNSLMGQLPSTISCLSGIEVLNIGHNQLSGELSDLVCDLRSLANLTVAYNFFSGFSQDCAKLFFRNVGFDFTGNCIPGRNMQRPPPQCSGVPGGGLSCLRIPSPRPVACAMAGLKGMMNYPLPSSLPPAHP